ncbi:RNA polymerase sigma factor [Alicyclobacillus sp. ALC3]|uniref:RNA polymerase sigma factor n=1 Tax=Alicyclobacillus sp. ALC3 TaxID=2796143 RepID=UPI002378141C|nr:RNA polymerase sigma factor [Alicyclobacillus sp. ALC3]WDL99214.1 RNA polymerase sigma factor [Alicyclobacillus sp. ALC3]
MGDHDEAQDAIQVLYEKYAGDVYRFARIMLSSDCDAKDVVQETFLRAFRSWQGFRQESNPKTWFISIVRNCVNDMYGKRKRELALLRNYEPPYLRSGETEAETVVIIEDALSRLKDSYRQVVFLRHIENMSVEDTARALGWSESKVTTTTQRALKRLRGILDDGNEKGAP